MTSRELLKKTLNHQQPERIVLDMGSTAVTGIHVKALEGLRNYYGLEKKPVRVIEPYQMLGQVDQDLIDAVGIDVIGIYGRDNMLGFNNLPPLKTVKTFWGQEIAVPQKYSTTIDENGDLISFPDGDTSVQASAKMPKSSFFFDAIERGDHFDDMDLKVEDNTEEFTLVSDEILNHWKKEIDAVKDSGKGIIGGLVATAFGDIAFVPGMQLKNPKGVRSIAEWYMSTLVRPDYVKAIFEKQAEVALENLDRIYKVVGENIDVLFVCGTDFGTQTSTFCSPDVYDDLWMPYYKRINDWVHTNTGWKTFKHSCGAVEGFMPHFIESGFDIINPVQISATGMDSKLLKEKYGKDLTFWGGGINTQTTFYTTPEKVREEVLRQCEILGKDGGFVFNTVHNLQANVPVENIVAMINAIKEFSS